MKMLNFFRFFGWNGGQTKKVASYLADAHLRIRKVKSMTLTSNFSPAEEADGGMGKNGKKRRRLTTE